MGGWTIRNTNGTLLEMNTWPIMKKVLINTADSLSMKNVQCSVYEKTVLQNFVIRRFCRKSIFTVLFCTFTFVLYFIARRVMFAHVLPIEADSYSGGTRPCKYG